MSKKCVLMCDDITHTIIHLSFVSKKLTVVSNIQGFIERFQGSILLK